MKIRTWRLFGSGKVQFGIRLGFEKEEAQCKKTVIIGRRSITNGEFQFQFYNLELELFFSPCQSGGYKIIIQHVCAFLVCSMCCRCFKVNIDFENIFQTSAECIGKYVTTSQTKTP